MYPVSGNWETRISGVTTIKKAWADATDAALNGLYSGNRSVLGLVFGQAGYAAVTRPGAGVLQPYEFIPDLPSDRVLVRQWAVTNNGGLGTVYYRVYQTATGFEEVVNASYSNTGTQWTQDSAAWESRRRKISYLGAFVWQSMPTGSPSWFDGAWASALSVSATSTDAPGRITSATSKSGVTLPTPAVNPGEFWKDGAVLAWCRFDIVAGVVTLRRAFNVSAINNPSAGIYDVTLTAGVGAGGHLVPHVTPLSTAVAPPNLYVPVIDNTVNPPGLAGFRINIVKIPDPIALGNAALADPAGVFFIVVGGA